MHLINVNAQKRRFLKMHLINVNAQKRRFLKMLQYPIMSFTKPENAQKNRYLWLRIFYQADQCECTKTYVFLLLISVQKRSNVNG